MDEDETNNRKIMKNLPGNMKNKKKPRGRSFPPGVSGNPQGKPIGSKNHKTLIGAGVTSETIQELRDKISERARQGNVAALCFVLNNIKSVNWQNAAAFNVE